ncbi:MAG: hypothetical protein JSU68_03880 [Phycisphaerales bacterium]|nr:MAG: hypothetical protein JSU68_03880 [Phycisphaerales bacterium]
MSKYHDDATVASDAGRITLSDEKLRRFHPELYKPWARFLGLLPLWFPTHWFGTSFRWRDVIEEHVRLGDSRAALVMATDPVIVAAYTDELDCVALLRFDSWVREHHNLRESDRLLTVNTYVDPDDGPPAPDLIFGPQQCCRWVDFWPIIADFVTDDAARLAARKAQIDDAEWERTRRMAARLLARPKVPPRDGAPMHSLIPSKDADAQ